MKTKVISDRSIEGLNGKIAKLEAEGWKAVGQHQATTIQQQNVYAGSMHTQSRFTTEYSITMVQAIEQAGDEPQAREPLPNCPTCVELSLKHEGSGPEPRCSEHPYTTEQLPKGVKARLEKAAKILDGCQNDLNRGEVYDRLYQLRCDLEDIKEDLHPE